VETHPQEHGLTRTPDKHLKKDDRKEHPQGKDQYTGGNMTQGKGGGSGGTDKEGGKDRKVLKGGWGNTTKVFPGKGSNTSEKRRRVDGGGKSLHPKDIAADWRLPRGGRATKGRKRKKKGGPHGEGEGNLILNIKRPCWRTNSLNWGGLRRDGNPERRVPRKQSPSQRTDNQQEGKSPTGRVRTEAPLAQGGLRLGGKIGLGAQGTRRQNLGGTGCDNTCPINGQC